MHCVYVLYVKLFSESHVLAFACNCFLKLFSTAFFYVSRVNLFCDSIDSRHYILLLLTTIKPMVWC